MSSENGTPRAASGPTEILQISLIMLRSLVRFQLAPPIDSQFTPSPAPGKRRKSSGLFRNAVATPCVFDRPATPGSPDPRPIAGSSCPNPQGAGGRRRLRPIQIFGTHGTRSVAVPLTRRRLSSAVWQKRVAGQPTFANTHAHARAKPGRLQAHGSLAMSRPLSTLDDADNSAILSAACSDPIRRSPGQTRQVRSCRACSRLRRSHWSWRWLPGTARCRHHGPHLRLERSPYSSRLWWQ